MYIRVRLAHFKKDCLKRWCDHDLGCDLGIALVVDADDVRPLGPLELRLRTAADGQHATIAMGPRLCRRDQQLMQQIVPLFDPTGRVILESDDPAITSE